MEARTAHKKWWTHFDDSLEVQQQIKDVKILAVTRRHDEEDHKKRTFIQTWKGMLEGYAVLKEKKQGNNMRRSMIDEKIFLGCYIQPSIPCLGGLSSVLALLLSRF